MNSNKVWLHFDFPAFGVDIFSTGCFIPTTNAFLKTL